MHDAKVVREQVDDLRAGMERRGALAQHGPAIDRAVALDVERRAIIQRVEERKAARNASSAEVARRKRSGENADALIATGRRLGADIGELEAAQSAVDGALRSILLELPNVTLAAVPAGGESANVVVRSWGTPRASEGVRPHWEIAEEQGLIDLARAAKISGSGFAVFRADGARLVRALMNFFLDTHSDLHGYEEIWAPALVNRASMTGTGQLPKFEDDAYRIEHEDLFLIPTAEVPVTNLYRDEILEGSALPRGFCAYTPCFRREAGSAGKDTRGVLRMHQFDKVELVRYCTPEDSEAELALLLGHAEQMLQQLGIPYRVTLLAAGDTGFSSAMTYDLEAWAPGVGTWLEVSSCSTFTDFQARRANIRYRPAQGEKPRFVHTLNGSGLAFPRTIACILEHYQQADGSVTVPEVLRRYMGRDTLVRR